MALFDCCIFDAFGTLFRLDLPHQQLDQLAGERAEALMNCWRQKQLEYTWLRSLLRRHANFEQLTRDALQFAVDQTQLQEQSEAIEQLLLPIYQSPDCFEEVPTVLQQLKKRGLTTAILSNGTPQMLQNGVDNTGIADSIDHLFSIESVGVFKPDPRVYQMAVARLGLARHRILFISSNAWDVAGAAAAGLAVGWVNRQNQPPERLPAKATYEVKDLRDILQKIETPQG
ncbi:MAG: haloacid dehalogenase type II [Bacteroidota bacterium]